MQSVLGKRKKIGKKSIYSFPKSEKNVLPIPRGEWNWFENNDDSCYAICVLEAVVRIDEIMDRCIDRTNYFQNFLRYTKYRLSNYYNVYKVARCLNAERITSRLYKKLNYPKFYQERLFKNGGGWHQLLFQRLRKKLSLTVPVNLYENEWRNRMSFSYKQPDIFSFNIYIKHKLSLPSIRMRKEMKFALTRDCSLQSLVKKYVLLNFPKILVIEIEADDRMKFCLDVPETLILKKKKINVDTFEYEKTVYLSRRKEHHVRIPEIPEASDKATFSLKSMILYEFSMSVAHVVVYAKEKENEWRILDSASSNKHPTSPYNPEYGKRNATLLIYSRH